MAYGKSNILVKEKRRAMSNKYDDIINLPHHVSKTRPQMSMHDRAAQFSPFSALTGYDAAIKETGRRTEKRVEPDEDELQILNMKLKLLIDNIDEEPEVTFTYFKPDERKSGGKYVEVFGVVKKADDFNRLIVMRGGEKIKMDDVIDISFSDMSFEYGKE